MRRRRPSADALIGAEAFDRSKKRLEILEGIARGEQAVEEGRVVSHPAAKKRLARWLK